MPTFTLATLETYVWDRLDNNTQWYPELQVRYALNQGLRRINLLTGFNNASVAVPGNSVINQYLYNVPAGIIVPLRIEFNGSEIQPSTIGGLVRQYRDWISDVSANFGPVARWAPIGITQFVIHPADSIGGRVILVTGIAPVPALAVAGDIVDLPDEFTEILIAYSVQRVQAKDSAQAVQAAQILYQQVQQQVGNMMLWESSLFKEQDVLKKGK